MNVPRITALIDTYNHERFIAEAIDSVLAQDFPAGEMEILVVDDGSTDRTPEIIRSYGSRVRHIRKKNGGQASALNAGFAEARGEFIAMLDGDDVWLPQKVRRVMETFEQHPEVGLVYHPYQYWQMEHGYSHDDLSFVPLSGKVYERPENMLQYGGLGTCSMAFRRGLAMELLPIPEECVILADTYLICTAVFQTPVAAVDECLTRYRHHGDNLSAFSVRDAARSRRAFESSRAAVEGAKRWLAAHGRDLSSPAPRTLFERMRLTVQVNEFAVRPPGRSEFLGHMRDMRRLYRPLWPRGYRAYHAALSAAGFLVGYRRFHRMRDRYRNSAASRRTREAMFPASSRKIAYQ